MPRSSPPTERVVAILRLLAGANKPLTLTEIAQALQLNLSTCQTILNTLTDGGVVVRSAQTKAYTLGPTLIMLGDAARTLTPLLERAGGIIDELYGEIGYGITLMMPAGDELIVVHRAGAPSRFPVRAMVEGPFPFAAPFGATLVARAPVGQQEAWLGRVPEKADADPLLHRALLETIRERGWCAWIYSDTIDAMMPNFDTILHSLARDTRSSATVRQVFELLALSGSRGYLSEELDRADELSVTQLTAPTRLPIADLEIIVHVFERSISRARLVEVAQATLRAASRIAELDD